MDSPKLVVINEEGRETVLYEPLPHQVAFHASNAPNLLALGSRGTGKSLQIRMDALMRCLAVPNFRALILRRTMPELRKSHLVYIEREAKLLGGIFLSTVFLAKFPNGSTIQFGHCETEADTLNYLSSEYLAIYFDELSTWSINQFLQISAAARAPEDSPFKALIRAGSNPLGVGAEWMEQWFVTKNVPVEDYPDYNPDDFEMIFSTLDDNPHLDRKAYISRLKNLPEHVRRAWLLGEFVNEGAYFMDFHKSADPEAAPPRGLRKGDPWHVIENIPLYHDPRTGVSTPIDMVPWINVYRAIDWGYFPDPAVCLWIAVLPNKRAICFKERHWRRTLAKDVAAQIRRESEGMHVVDSPCDPTMEIKTGVEYSIGEIFETNGVPVTAATNDRALYGFAIHDYLNTEIDGFPQLQIVKHGCPNLIRTIQQMRMDKADPRKMANGDDHWVVALAYFAMTQAVPSQDPVRSEVPQWMRSKPRKRSW